MKNKSKNKSDDKYHIRDSETISMKASTGMDCTGLIPSLPDTESQLESYQELYSYLPQAAAPKNKKN